MSVGLLRKVRRGSAISHAAARRDMWWLRLVGSLKWQVSVAKEPYERDDILQKKPVILRSLLIVAAQYAKNGGCVG